jgi:hypothetical protein
MAMVTIRETADHCTGQCGPDMLDDVIVKSPEWLERHDREEIQLNFQQGRFQPGNLLY